MFTGTYLSRMLGVYCTQFALPPHCGFQAHIISNVISIWEDVAERYVNSAWRKLCHGAFIISEYSKRSYTADSLDWRPKHCSTLFVAARPCLVSAIMFLGN